MVPSNPPYDRLHSTLRYRAALQAFISRIDEDKNILAAVLVGSINESTIWRKDSFRLWIVEADGVSRRLKSDGDEVRVFRTFVEDGINVQAEIIPRTRFKQMVEGSSRTAFSCSFFAKRELVYCDEPSISKWFKTANAVATNDQAKERMIATSWVIGSSRYARKTIERKEDLELGFEAVLWATHSIAAVEVINAGDRAQPRCNQNSGLCHRSWSRRRAQRRPVIGLWNAGRNCRVKEELHWPVSEKVFVRKYLEKRP